MIPDLRPHADHTPRRLAVARRKGVDSMSAFDDAAGRTAFESAEREAIGPAVVAILGSIQPGEWYWCKESQLSEAKQQALRRCAAAKLLLIEPVTDDDESDIRLKLTAAGEVVRHDPIRTFAILRDVDAASAPPAPVAPPVEPLVGGGDANSASAPPPAETKFYVTLQQMASIVQRSKRTLELMKKKGKLPAPDIKAPVSGAPDEWLWSTVRPILEDKFARTLPEAYPKLTK